MSEHLSDSGAPMLSERSRRMLREREFIGAGKTRSEMATRGVVFFAYFLLDKQKKVGQVQGAAPGRGPARGRSPLPMSLGF